MRFVIGLNFSIKSAILFRFLIITSLILFCNTVCSQRVPLKGKIHAEGGVDVEGVNIVNLSTVKGSVTDSQGNFEIAVGLHDTLSISAIHIHTTSLVIGKEQMSTKIIIINLSEKRNELATVTLRKALTGYIGTDANLIRTDKPITATSIGLPNADRKQLSKTERQLYAASSGPVDALVNMLSGRTKMLKRRLELHKTTELTLFLLDKVPETYFTDVLKIEKFKIYSFLFFCEDDPNYKKITKGSYNEIIQFLKIKSEVYKDNSGKNP